MKEHNNIPESALNTIIAVLEEPKEPFGECNTPQLALWHCMVFIAKKMKQVLKKPVHHERELTLEEQLQSLCEYNKLQTRTIELSEDWWKKDIGPVLGFYESVKHPTAIIPLSFDRYLVIVPSKNIKSVLTADLAKKLLPNAVMFYRTLPEKSLKGLDVAKFSFTNLRFDGLRILVMQILIGFLGFLTPIAMGIIFGQIIPHDSRVLLLQIIIILAVNVLVMTLFETVLLISALRIRLKITASLQAAIWDRVIRLPIRFFRGFTTGDIANRASGVDEIQHILTNSVLVSISGGTLSLMSLALMFYYSMAIALGTAMLLVIIASVTLIINARQLSYLRRNLMLQGKLTGFVLQLITSISKLKITNSTARAFIRWSEIFSEKNQASYQSGKLMVGMTLFSSAFAVISTAIFFVLVFSLGKNLSFGNFITVNALFGQCLISVISLVGVLTSIMTIFPLYERIKPILEALPEQYQGIQMGTLTGSIDLTHVSFRYSEKTPVVFKDLTFRVNPGEMVAFVGASGSGKSTLFRLLLGLEQIQTGKIYYSNMDLSNININSIRKQSGVVLQDSVLFSGSILENIVGHSMNYDIKEVQKLLKQVCFTEDLKSMPMGLHTLLTEQGKTLSNGQRQRLLLARALFKRPNLLLLDEATSSLDNVTQEKIYRHLATLNLTCLVIAHRPSTLQFADRIYVIENGKVVQSGTFDALLNKGGLFKELMRE